MNQLIEKIVLGDTNTEFELRGADGKAKKLWNETRIGKALRKLDLNIRIPFVTGFYGSTMKTHNLIVNVGHAGANGLMSNQGSYSPFIYLAIGTNATAASATDTTLGTEITTGGGARASATASQVTTTVTNDTTQLVHTWTFTSTFAVVEEGILDAASVGHLLAHQVFSAINVVSGDSLQVTHKYQT